MATKPGGIDYGASDLMSSLPLYARCATTAVLALLISGPATATTCAVTYSTLADDYAHAESIAVMQVNGCANGGIPQFGRCPDEQYQLAVIEILKDSVPPRAYGGDYTGGEPMGCGMPLTLDNTYLLFLTGEGTFSHAASAALVSDSPMHTKTRERLRVLREYRDGKVGDLSDPWSFSDNGVSCSLSQAAGGRSLSFMYWYREGPAIAYSPEPEVDGNGNTRYRLNPRPDLGIEIEDLQQSSMKVEHNTLIFRVDFRPDIRTVENTGTVTVGNASWPLRSTRFVLKQAGRSIAQVAFEGTQGDAATEILAAMRRAPSDVVVSATRTFSMGDEFPNEQNIYASIETRSTQIVDTAKRFTACMDGSERVPVIE